MIRKWQKMMLAAGLGCGAFLSGADILFEQCRDASAWQFHNGGEFPGATGGIAATGQGIEMTYDFSGGGEYVAAVLDKTVPPEARTAKIILESTRPAALTFRLDDADGRTFQKHSIRLAEGTPKVLELDFDGEWAGSWGGASEYDRPRTPIRRIGIIVNRDGGLPAEGAVLIRRIELTGGGLVPAPFRGEDFAGSVNGASWRGVWKPAAQGIALDLACTVERPEALRLEFDFPTNGRSQVQRFRVEPGETVLNLSFPAENPRNIYQIEMLAARGGETLRRTLTLTGDDADPADFGPPRSSREIPTARFGCSVHFGFAGDPNGSVPWWHDYRTLLDDMSECGVKVLRGELKYRFDPEVGKYRIDDYDRAWATYARELGMEVIFLINDEVIPGQTSAGEYAALCRDLAEDTAGLIEIYELLNEPGGDRWSGPLGGTWNAREPDNSTSPWALEVLRWVNAGADAIKAVRPDATVIALGTFPPVNIRMLQAGLTTAVDGIADHPYAYSMPPEKVPWGEAFGPRDGLVVGDADSSFDGLIEGYEEYIRQSGVPRTLWITEYGFTTFRFSGGNETAIYAGFSEEAQAVYLLRRMLLALRFPIIKAVCQYDYLDDYYSQAYEPEANFGIIRGDHSRKPAWYATQRFHSIFSDAVPAQGVQAVVTAEPLHRSARRYVLIPDWDNSVLNADNEVITLALTDPYRPQDRLLAVWSAQPYSGEFNNRAAALEVSGWDIPAEWNSLVALDLITGRSFDVGVRREGGKVVIDRLELGRHPLLLRF